MNDAAADNTLLLNLTSRLESYGKKMADFMLPEPLETQSEIQKEHARRDVLSSSQLYLSFYSKLNKEQMTVFEEIQASIQQASARTFYIDGGPGRGKSFLLKTIVHFTRSIGKIALCCASTGFVAIMYPEGRTAHNLFRIPVREDDFDMVKIECDILMNSQRAELLQHAHVII